MTSTKRFGNKTNNPVGPGQYDFTDVFEENKKKKKNPDWSKD